MTLDAQIGGALATAYIIIAAVIGNWPRSPLRRALWVWQAVALVPSMMLGLLVALGARRCRRQAHG